MNEKQRRIARKKRIRKRRMIRRVRAALLALLLVVAVFFIVRAIAQKDQTVPATPEIPPAPTATYEPTAEPTLEPTPSPTPAPTSAPVDITLSFTGDCTLGGDMLGPSESKFFQTIAASGAIDYEYCFRNVRDIFAADDLTIVNLEVVLTQSSSYNSADPSKIYIMRGKPSYAQMLPKSNIELANIANNHMTDFGETGIEETIGYLKEQGVGYFGYGRTWYEEIEGVKFGFVGINTWTTETADMKAVISEVRDNSDVLIVSFHWGNELEYNATEKQQGFAHMAVDLGADLVVGHHPHVVNGIEVYKGVNVVYSLGNFCFGGKANPKDKDTFIYQHIFTVQDGKVLASKDNVIPCKITSVKDESYNNYQPTPVTGEKADAILRKIEKYSQQFETPLDLID